MSNAITSAKTAVPCDAVVLGMSADRHVSRHNWIAPRLTPDFGPGYVAAKQAAPPRGVPR